MKAYYKVVLLAFFAQFVVMGCGGGDDIPANSCTTNVAGCPSSFYSCPAESLCYESHESCANAGGCPAN